MNHLIIQPKDEKDKVFLKELLQKLGYDSKEINLEDDEDTYFLEFMVSEKKGNYVTKSEILKALGSEQGITA
jgi:glutaredoxin